MSDLEIDILFEDPRWEEMGLLDLVRRSYVATLDALGLDPEEFSLSVLACNDARIAVLNTEFRDKETPTNVLSWPAEDLSPDIAGGTPHLPEGGFDPELGDIAISYDTMEREAKSAEITLESHVLHLVTHSILHLLGYDHIYDEDAAVMEALEIRILETMGIANPYESDKGS